jgi:hypothetical protein
MMLKTYATTVSTDKFGNVGDSCGPAPTTARMALIVLPRTVHVPLKFMSPPPRLPELSSLPPDWLAARRQLLTVMVAPVRSLSRAPPLPKAPAPPARLPTKTQLLMVGVEGGDAPKNPMSPLRVTVPPANSSA